MKTNLNKIQDSSRQSQSLGVPKTKKTKSKSTKLAIKCHKIQNYLKPMSNNSEQDA